MLVNENGGLSSLIQAGIELPSNALGIFSKITETTPIYIVLKHANEEICTLQFDLEDIHSPNRTVTHIVGATVEQLLNSISALEAVQNKKQN